MQGGITFEEAKAFAKFLDSITDVEMALSMYLAAGASITVGEWSDLIGQNSEVCNLIGYKLYMVSLCSYMYICDRI